MYSNNLKSGSLFLGETSKREKKGFIVGQSESYHSRGVEISQGTLSNHGLVLSNLFLLATFTLLYNGLYNGHLYNDHFFKPW